MAWIKEPSPYGVWEEADGQCRIHGMDVPTNLRRPCSKDEALLIHQCLTLGYEHGKYIKVRELKNVLGID